MTITDATLTDAGHGPTGAGRVLVLGCGALAREILAIKSANKLDHIDLACLPAILHNTPARIVPALREALDTYQSQYDTVFLAYGDCGTGGALENLAKERGVAMLPGAHCYAFFDGVEQFAAREEYTAFYLTDFLARQFDAFVIRPLGLDRHPELRDAYFGNYETLVYLAQTSDPALEAKAKAAAKALGLTYVLRPTGYGDLAPALTLL
ncbi:MAG: DUF1638 domain-containing protein [Maritimibacter sp.]